ncbi:lytic transglycosylase domain-containing protein [Burkholderia cenocepacia]|uniref:lytic transglycosylase domain-containing protein n=1 Tax=Burkholderia cenocepacia TaxID=95486 RepID=UPI00264B2F97|nr:lytic transglycosylase domain-containing protein [Burkholderia cenocepacia]MDN7452302.1 lytic transglycosylase domain-containing protein [Burkholderia cenocepacia]
MIVGGMRAAAVPGAPDGRPPATRSVVRTYAQSGNASPHAAQPVQTDARTTRRVLSLASLVSAAAREYRLDMALLMAVIHVESGGDPRAVSPKGATGLMQLMPATGSAYGARDLFDRRQNIAAGARLLRDLLKRYGSRELALAAYNAGPGAVDRHGRRVPPFAETRQYVVSVSDRYAQYRQLLDAGGLGGGPASGTDTDAFRIVPATWPLPRTGVRAQR